MYLKQLVTGFTVLWETLDEMHDVCSAIVKLRTKFPSGHTDIANDRDSTCSGQEEASAFLESLKETVTQLEREGPRLLSEARQALCQPELKRKSGRDSPISDTSISELGGIQPTPIAAEPSQRAERENEPSSTS